MSRHRRRSLRGRRDRDPSSASRRRSTSLRTALSASERPPLWLFVAFFLSGAAALVYQVAWQRMLFAIYGIDIASVTIVVTAFMLGLGLGSLVGGWLSRRRPTAAVALFAGFELGIGAFGALSPRIFEAVAEATAGVGHVAAGALTLALVSVPTMLMGATLPLLVGWVAQRSGNVGRSVGSLYSVNTFGAAAGAVLAASVVLGRLGLAGSLRSAAVLNLALGISVLLLARHPDAARLDR